MLDPTQLRYFVAIARHGNITKAAKELRTSQPTLTVALKNLEDQLGTTLVLRERTGVRLTQTGDELLRVANEVFEVMNLGEQRIRGLERDDVGEFVIGCHESLGAYFLPDFMAEFLRENPGIELTLSNASSRETTNAVLERKVHFGVVVNAQAHPDLVMLELFHDAMDIMISRDAPPPSRVEAPPSRGSIPPGRGSIPPPSSTGAEAALALASLRLRLGPLIFAGRVSEARELLDQLGARGIVPERTLSCGDLELVKALCLAGIGPALLPRRVAAYGHEGKIVRLHPSLPFFTDTISLVYRADMHKTRAAVRVKDALTAYGRLLDQTQR
jgi:molybdate transport repressor ModE-like protein